MEGKRILLSRPDRLGDLVITTACLPSVRKAFPDCRLALLAASDYVTLFRDHPDIDEYISYTEGSSEWADALEVFNPKISLHLHPNDEIAASCERIGVPERIGYEDEAVRMTRSIPYTKHKGLKHEIEYVFDLLSELSIDRPATFESRVMSASLPEDINPPNRFCVFHIGSFGNKASVPKEVFSELGRWLDDEYGIPVLLIGSENEKAYNEELIKDFEGSGMVNLCGSLDPAQLSGLLSKALFFVGRDSGPAHVAAASGAAVFCFMPAARPDISVARWTPLGRDVNVIGPQGKARVWEKTEAANSRIFRGIDVEAVKESLVAVIP